MINHQSAARLQNRLIFQRKYEWCEDCCICLHSMRNRSVLHLPCGHVLHGPCFRRWQKKRNNCPVCRARVETLDSPVHKTETLSLFELLGVGLEVLMQLSDVGSESASASTITATTTTHDEDLQHVLATNGYSTDALSGDE